MSSKLGPRTFGKKEDLVFLGREISEQRDYSDRVAETIDEEVHSLIDNAYETAKTLLAEHKAKLARLARYLIDHETAEGDVLQELFTSAISDSPEPAAAD